MTNLDNARRAAGELLRRTTGSELPEWRVTFTEYGVHHEANAIAPVCTDEDHLASEDPTAFECCPEPIIDVGPELAEYLVELLNADRAAAADARANVVLPAKFVTDAMANVPDSLPVPPQCPVCSNPPCHCSCFGKQPRKDCPHQSATAEGGESA